MARSIEESPYHYRAVFNDHRRPENSSVTLLLNSACSLLMCNEPPKLMIASACIPSTLTHPCSAAAVLTVPTLARFPKDNRQSSSAFYAIEGNPNNGSIESELERTPRRYRSMKSVVPRGFDPREGGDASTQILGHCQRYD